MKTEVDTYEKHKARREANTTQRLRKLGYILLQLLFIPPTLIVLIPTIYKEMIITKKLGVSFTAVQALQFRWMQHYFDKRSSKETVEFVKVFVCESQIGLLISTGPLILSKKLFGYNTRLTIEPDKPEDVSFTNYTLVRLIKMDELFVRSKKEVEQVVLMGAGYDLRLLEFDFPGVKCFEIDQTNTQKIKTETIAKTKMDNAHIRYVPVDYSVESWSDKLLEFGFDPTKKTLFFWESVSLYLEAEAVEYTLKKVAELSVPGSILIQDLYSKDFIEGKVLKVGKTSQRFLEKMGEPMKFGLDMSSNSEEVIRNYLKSNNVPMRAVTLYGSNHYDNKPFYAIVESVF